MKNLLNAVVESKPQQKRPTSDGKAIAIQIPGLIVLQAQNESQQYRTYELSNYIRDRHEKLTQSVQRRELTLSLEILEQSGITGELAIFALATIQNLGVVV